MNIANLIIKTAATSTAFLLAIAIFFNIGYFYRIDLKMIGLLSAQDILKSEVGFLILIVSVTAYSIWEVFFDRSNQFMVTITDEKFDLKISIRSIFAFLFISMICIFTFLFFYRNTLLFIPIFMILISLMSLSILRNFFNGISLRLFEIILFVISPSILFSSFVVGYEGSGRFIRTDSNIYQIKLSHGEYELVIGRFLDAGILARETNSSSLMFIPWSQVESVQSSTKIGKQDPPLGRWLPEYLQRNPTQ